MPETENVFPAANLRRGLHGLQRGGGEGGGGGHSGRDAPNFQCLNLFIYFKKSISIGFCADVRMLRLLRSRKE